ncbi:MAG: tol-pal system protein YbgF [Methylobacter sp.]|nr:MAG: tol-pal system protein YbgF [Methylobacter sp.]
MKKRLVIVLGAYCCFAADVYALPEVIDNSAYPASALPATNLAPSPSTSSLMEMTGRLEQLQSEVQQLTGKLEEQSNTITELKKQQKSMYADFEERFQSIEAKSAGSAQPPTEATDATSPPPASPEAQQAVTPAAAVAAAEGGAPANTAPAAATPPAAQAQVSDTENQEYKAAYLALRKGHTDESITAFKDYLGKYPASGLANNAQYWLGEAYLVNNDAESARNAFNSVIEKYPGSNKEPDALLMLGKIEMDQKNTDKAREYFTLVTTKFPNSTAARSAAKKLLLLNVSQ